MNTYRKVIHRGKEDIALDNLGNGGARLLQNSLKVLAALIRLFADRALYHGSLSGEGDLARAVNGRGRLDRLGLRAGKSKVY